MKYYTLKVINICPETNDSATIIFKQPGLKRINYFAGQYLSLILRINGRRYIRPYSFSSAPGVEDTLNITIKRVQGGIVSNHIIDKLKIGDIVEVMEPMGSFILGNNICADNNHIYLWGAGSGITPLISIAKYALYHKKAASVTLAYGNRSYENIIFKNEIERLRNDFAGIFNSQHFITNPFVNNDTPSIVQGRITSQKVKAIISSQSRIDNSLHYICGPIGLKESVKSVLKECGVDNNHILTEDFEVHRNPKEFENIHTQFVSLKKDGITNRIEVVTGKSILEAGLDTLIDLSYSCQTGNCLVCKGRLLKGEIKMIGLHKIPSELKPNEYLLCCSFPLNDLVEIEVL